MLHLYLFHVSDEAYAEKRSFEAASSWSYNTRKKTYSHTFTQLLYVFTVYCGVFRKNEEVEKISDSSLGKISPVSPPLHWKEPISCSCLHQWHFNLMTKAAVALWSWTWDLWFLNVYGYIRPGKCHFSHLVSLHLSVQFGYKDFCFLPLPMHSTSHELRYLVWSRCFWSILWSAEWKMTWWNVCLPV